MSETHMEQKKIDLDALEAALAKATPGPWRRGNRGEYVVVHLDHNYIVCDEDPEDDNAERVEADTDTIIAAHNALPALIAELRQLRARVTPEPIGEKHQDGNWWLVWSPLGNQWYKALWHNGHWEMTGRLGLFNKATHALPLPPALEDAAMKEGK